MKRSHQDVENLFASQGIPGRYRELARHPAPSNDKPQNTSKATAKDRASEVDTNTNLGTSDRLGEASLKIAPASSKSDSAPPRRGLARLGLVITAPRAPEKVPTERPLGELFSRLSKPEATRAYTPELADRVEESQPLRHLQLPALFAHLERNGQRR